MFEYFKFTRSIQSSPISDPSTEFIFDFYTYSSETSTVNIFCKHISFLKSLNRMNTYENNNIIIYSDISIYINDLLTLSDISNDPASIIPVSAEVYIKPSISTCKNVRNNTLNGYHLKDISYYFPVLVRLVYTISAESVQNKTILLSPLRALNKSGVYLLLDISAVGKIKSENYQTVSCDFSKNIFKIADTQNNILKSGFIDTYDSALTEFVESKIVITRCPKESVERVYDLLGMNVSDFSSGIPQLYNYHGYILNDSDRNYSLKDCLNKIASDKDCSSMTGGNNTEAQHVIQLCTPKYIENKNIIGVFTTYSKRPTSNTSEHFAIVETCKHCKQKIIMDYYNFASVKCVLCGGLQ